MRRCRFALLAVAACASTPTSPALPPVVDTPPASAPRLDAPALETPPSTPPGPQDDLVWLRERAPGLGELRDGAPAVPELLAWVPPDQPRPLWLIAGPYRCAQVIAARSGSDRLALSIIASERRVRGRRERTLRPGDAGYLLTLGEGRRREHQARDGSWVADPGETAASGGTVAGALRAVEGEVASYDARPVHLRVTCPVVRTTCPEGGSHACRDCARFEVGADVITELHMGHLIRGPAREASDCREPCPDQANPDKDRAERVVASLAAPWIAGPPAPVGLYQSQTACEAALAQAH